MTPEQAVSALAAIAHPIRLQVYRRLVQAGQAGLPAGQLSSELALANSTLSFHIKALHQAKLVHARPLSRFIYYSADYAMMNALLAYLTEHCCADQSMRCECTEVVGCTPTMGALS